MATPIRRGKDVGESPTLTPSLWTARPEEEGRRGEKKGGGRKAPTKS